MLYSLIPCIHLVGFEVYRNVVKSFSNNWKYLHMLTFCGIVHPLISSGNDNDILSQKTFYSDSKEAKATTSIFFCHQSLISCFRANPYSQGSFGFISVYQVCINSKSRREQYSIFLGRTNYLSIYIYITVYPTGPITPFYGCYNLQNILGL